MTDWSTAIGDVLTLGIRLTNALLWTAVGWKILRLDRPVRRLTRRVITTIVVFGMWTLVIGGLTSYGVPGDVARLIYTAFTVYSAIVAAALLREPEV